jgi:alanine-alpha-ketoisovalerate/valine-pyruvate aminotransferase
MCSLRALTAIHLFIKVIIVPGIFFDINPRHTRTIRKSKCINFVRFSYGPGMQNLEKGVQQIGEMIKYWKTHQESAEMYALESFE